MSVATALEKQAADPQSPLRSGLLTRHLQASFKAVKALLSLC
jgi:hypothetical protein